MGEQTVRRLQNPPHRRLLVPVQRDRGTRSRQGEMIAVKGAEPDVVELIIVFADKPFAAFVVAPDPFLEAIFYLLLLVAHRFGRGTVHHVAFFF